MDDVHPLRAEGILQPAGVVKLSREDGLYRGRGGDYRAIDQARDKRRPIVVVDRGGRSRTPARGRPRSRVTHGG